MSMQPILADTELDERLLKEGYVVVPFLSEQEVAQLTDFYAENHPDTHEGMYATAHVPDVAFRMKMNDFIKQVFARAIGAYFVNCQPLGGSFIAKGKGKYGTLHPHQDWNIVDEDVYRSFNIWVPLVDLTEQNGAIKILPQSHAWLKTYRSANTPAAYGEVNDLLWQKMVPLFMKKGEALIYDHRLLHASGENFTDELRLAAVYGIIPQGAQMYYYHKAGEDTVEVFESNPEFFLYGNIFEGPKGLTGVRSFAHTFHHHPKALRELITGEPEPEEKPVHTAAPAPEGFWSRLRKKLAI